ncbi:Branched-chain amino acid aminotransferase/4-amino-4-deoxychorismate lyase [Streptomyces sp. DvalAA-14]|uniref:aminotransferase class IV family protein n=1 Tax=unclassified Streptomyces TaxID=2593676 RepID=UPI00081B7CD4|nr:MULTISPECIES: aminotransferase class IV family protein [unclassified Streptomyces]MYS22823.1 aminotransferase [Streptomyces sp. SID4948]SCE22866.1 Branched-chain amino acid aminotransferase/4-amino-4-deoxychorismate lyase [Streptomyces sp. DvalAA-14]
MAELNGRPVTPDELQTLALTNYGSFTSLRVDEGRVRGLSLHMERLVRDSRVLFGVDLDPEYIRGLIRRVAPTSGSTTIRVTVFDPATDLGHPDRADDPQVLVTQRPAGALPLPPLAVRSTVYRRDLPEVKSVALFGSLRHRRAAQLKGYDDALFVDGQGVISEGGTWNIGFFDGDQVIWPDAEALPGVTMLLLQDIHEHRVGRVTLADLDAMQAAFATNAAIGVRAIARIDGTPFAVEHQVLDVLRKEYTAVAGEPI